MNKRLFKTLISLFAAFLFSVNALGEATYGWAEEYLNFCCARGIIQGDETGNLMPDSNLTREQMVKMILNALNIDLTTQTQCRYTDIAQERWSYPYILKYQEYAIDNGEVFNPTEEVSREEFIAMTMKAAGYGDYIAGNIYHMVNDFSDWNEIDNKFFDLVVAAYDIGCVSGYDGMLRPKDKLTRAEACSMFYKIIKVIEEETKPVKTEPDPLYPPVMMIGKAEATVAQAKQWAINRGAHERFIEIADTYWEYGKITGIRPDIMYAQAAKETAYGRYTGQVKPEQNNWAGIKKYGQNGDAPEDHEDFETPEEGVRGHFNHMSAYVGVEPVGEPHGRYNSVVKLKWAGTVETLQQLGGKWCPDIEYGNSIIRDFLEPMKLTIVRQINSEGENTDK